MDDVLAELERTLPGCLPLVLNVDGFIVACTSRNEEERSICERLAAMCAALMALGEGVTRHMDGGKFQEMYIKGKKKYMIGTSVNKEHILCVVVLDRVKIGLAYDIIIQAARSL